MRKVDEHPRRAQPARPPCYDGRLFVPVPGLNEEGEGSRPNYPCCTFRGSLVALDANTGAVLWKTYTIRRAEPRGHEQGRHSDVRARGRRHLVVRRPIDARRACVYVATGNGYADPPQPMTDAVVAMDLQTGAVKWVRQTDGRRQLDARLPAAEPGQPGCPATLGPDHDFSASPSLATVNGRDLLVLPQKSGMAWAIDPDKNGEVVWQRRIGQGSGLGGQWGGAVDGQQAYFGVSDMLSPTPAACAR